MEGITVTKEKAWFVCRNNRPGAYGIDIFERHIKTWYSDGEIVESIEPLGLKKGRPCCIGGIDYV